MKIKVSVIVPVWNVEKYITKCLDSQAVFEKKFAQFQNIFTPDFCTICLLTKLDSCGIIKKRASALKFFHKF